MDEKILIKSEINAGLRKFLKRCPIICFIVAAVISIFLAIPIEVSRTEYSYWREEYYTYTHEYVGWEEIFDFDDDTMIFFFLFVIGSLCLLTFFVVGFMHLIHGKCALLITDKNVKGKTLFGKEVTLPLYMVSAYTIRDYLSTISIATSSGLTKFSLIKNYREIGNVLAQQINDRQKNTETNTPAATIVQQADNADQLKKFKDLLDSGIITQEEFDAKKKQLLGL